MLIPPGGAPRPHSAELLKHSQELRHQDGLTRQTNLSAVQLREQVRLPSFSARCIDENGFLLKNRAKKKRGKGKDENNLPTCYNLGEDSMTLDMHGAFPARS